MSYMYIFTPKPMGDSGGGGGIILSGDQCEHYIVHLFTLNKRNMTYITLQNVTLFLISTNNYYH